jgi:hypothetical protein
VVTADPTPRGFLAWFRHAFAIEKYDESALAPEERELLTRLARQIEGRKMTTAAILFLQSNRHMNWIGSQVMVGAAPIYDVVHTFVTPLLRTLGLYVHPDEMPILIAAFEKRYSIEFFVQQLEAAQAGELEPAPPVDITAPPAEDPAPELGGEDTPGSR